MSDAFVIDSSVAVEHLLKTPLGNSVTELLDRSSLVAPEMLDAEVLSVVRRNVLIGRLEVDAAETVLSDLVDWEVDRISHQTVVLNAWRHYQNVSPYDALYVATAEQFGLPLLTLDGRLARAAGIEIVVHDISSTEFQSLLQR
jgi:predicted nucleic acid-binding protein